MKGKYINKFLNIKISNTMKRFSFLAIMLTVFCLTANAQEGKSPRTIIAATGMNILYEGIDNPIFISVDGIADKNIIAEVSDKHANIRKIGNGEYVVNVDFPEEYTTIDVEDEDGTLYQRDIIIPLENKYIDVVLYNNTGNKKVFLNKRNFKVYELKRPKAEIIDMDGGFIDKEVLLMCPGISTYPTGVLSTVNYRVSEFMMIFDDKNDNNAPFVSKSEKFTPEMIERIKTLKKGDKIYIEGISVIMNGVPTPVENPTMIFTIK